MTTAVASRSTPVSMSRVAGKIVASLSGPTQELLRRQAMTDALLLRAGLEALFVNRFGEQPELERLRFLFFAAPLVRRLVMGSVNLNEPVAATKITFADVKSWLDWLDAMDPLCARMIDLRYFAGLTVKETAKLLDLPPAAVIRELRFARAWLRIELPSNQRSA